MKLRRVSFIASLAVLLNFLSFNPAQAADVRVLNSENSCFTQWGSSNIPWQGTASRFTAARAVTITKLTLSYTVNSGSYSPTSASGQKIAIWSNSGSLPGSIIGRLAYSSYSGYQVIFTGSVTLPSAGTYWMQILSDFSAYYCTLNAQDNTGSESGWSTQAGIAYGTSGSGDTTTAFTAFGSPQNAYSFGYSLYIAGPGTVNLALANPNSISKGIINTITATTSGAGKVTFYANNKKIGKCVAVPVLTTTATCPWKPVTSGAFQLPAIFTPTSGQAGTAQQISIVGGRRNTTR
jgi:hypothetical protein